MIKAWERVKSNKGAPGVDNMPIAGSSWGSVKLGVRSSWVKLGVKSLLGSLTASKSQAKTSYIDSANQSKCNSVVGRRSRKTSGRL